MTEKFNPKKIMEMAAYGRGQSVEEAGDYSVDYAMNSTGRDHYQVNMMGDNPLPLVEGGVDEMVVSALKDLLNDAGKTDEAIASGDVKIKPAAAEKFARLITSEPVEDAVSFVNSVMDQLRQSLNGQVEEGQLDEFQTMPTGARFAYEVDTLSNITISDAETGKEIFLKGQDAVELLGELEMYGSDEAKVQEILSQYQHVMEGDTLSEEVEGGRLHEIEPDVRNIQRKLNRMAGEAERDGDIMTAFAANLFMSKFKQLDAELADYLKTGKVNR